MFDAACAARLFSGWLNGTMWPNSIVRAQIFQRWKRKGDLRSCTINDSPGLPHYVVPNMRLQAEVPLKATDSFFTLGRPIPVRGIF